MAERPVVISGGKGTEIWDDRGNKYLDANSSIWTNLHGHQHPKINKAISDQLGRISHSSALGLANEPSAMLAEGLVKASNPSWVKRSGQAGLEKVFYSDDGSTAIETALKMAYEHQRRSLGIKSPRFISMDGGYHGDTIGGVSLGKAGMFHDSFRGLCFKTEKFMSPACYRCPFNKAKPERADGRDYRKCNWECVDDFSSKLDSAKKSGKPITSVIVEPLMQGAAGMIAQPKGWLKRIGQIAKEGGVQIIADEVMTGFGRTGILNHAGKERRSTKVATSPSLFAIHAEGIQPDFLCLAKGMTGGYLPMAATLTTQGVFDSFLGDYEELKTFFHGHSYTGNQLGSAASLASLSLCESEKSIKRRKQLEQLMSEELKGLWDLDVVGDIRQEGLVAGIELVRDWKTREAYDWREKAGVLICQSMATMGVMTRPVGNVIVLMPPYCTTDSQLRKMVRVMRKAIRETLT